MESWLIYDKEGADRNADYIRYHHELGSELDISFRTVICDETPVDSLLEKCFDRRPDFAIVRTIRPDINKTLESAGVVTYNSYEVSYISNDKKRCKEFISKNTTVPVVYMVSDPKPGDVIKPVSSHGGNGVRIIPEEGLSEEEKQGLNEGSLIAETYVDGPREDVRVYVIGKKIIAAVKRQASDGEFRANASLGGNIFPYELRDIDRVYVDEITAKLDFGMVGIDFIVDDSGAFQFNEIEDVVGARMLYKTHPDIDILKEYLMYIKGRI